MSAIEIEDVHKTYGSGGKKVAALRGVKLSVEPGEIFGLLGRNGAGKTTLVKVLLDIVRPTLGSTRILGVDSRKASARSPVGYLPEDHRLPEYPTAEGALHFYGRMAGLPHAERRKRVAELLDLVGLKDSARRKVRSFSKGMKQRLGFAQALVHQPKVLFLDEPTDGVDPLGRAQIREIIVREKAAGRTIFINSHLLSEVEQVCDRVGILEQGTLLREGTIESLTRTERIYSIRTAAPLPPAVINEVRAFVVHARLDNGLLEVSLAEDSDIDRVVELLRARGCALRHLESKRHSLEEVFLESLRAGEGGSP